MPYIQTSDSTQLYYREWGTGAPVLFVSAWGFSGAMWEYQMLYLSAHGLRCIAFDRRGHGRSDDPGRGYDIDQLSEDLAEVIAQLDLRDLTLVGNSMGCGEIVHYLARHDTSRIARVVLVSGITLGMLKSADNPQGFPREASEFAIARMQLDRPAYMTDGAIKYFGLGSTWPGPPQLSAEMVQWAIRLILECSPKATIECFRTSAQTDFLPDLPSCTVPTLILHGENDQIAPLNLSGRRTAQGIAGSELKIYPGGSHGMFLTHKERLNEDLLTFIQG
ncbi:arylesterase [Reticulibacter mediterranei]|uniref:Arylesterase n=1 Tax=Reticulibacter mediterranei TaxID=2778369 RepID=A0A8J3IG58_9CHLR|nr:alpha/beta hydrolase [Reticulibacter mediterranei]GHO90604.1 arylesterase [Reticulibacter mediterranei]